MQNETEKKSLLKGISFKNINGTRKLTFWNMFIIYYVNILNDKLKLWIFNLHRILLKFVVNQEYIP